MSEKKSFVRCGRGTDPDRWASRQKGATKTPTERRAEADAAAAETAAEEARNVHQNHSLIHSLYSIRARVKGVHAILLRYTHIHVRGVYYGSDVDRWW